MADKQAGVTGTKESGTSGRVTPDADTFEPAADGPTASEWREAEEKMQADDDARHDKAQAELSEELHAQERDVPSAEVKPVHEYLPEDKVRAAETPAERLEQERANSDRSLSSAKK
jgi:hypothetical protein